MNLYIKIENGVPKDHPIFEDNFLAAFPAIDINNLPPEFAKFVRVPMPKLSPYDKGATVRYDWVDGVVQDVWTVETMTAEERAAKIEEAKAYPHPASWVFNEEVCGWMPPFPPPSDGKQYRWDEPTLSWVEVVKPE